MILCDTGPLVAAAIVTDPNRYAAVELFTGLRLAGRRLLVPATVVAEVGYLLNREGGVRPEADFLRAVAQRDFELVQLTEADAARMAQLVEQYDDRHP